MRHSLNIMNFGKGDQQILALCNASIARHISQFVGGVFPKHLSKKTFISGKYAIPGIPLLAYGINLPRLRDRIAFDRLCDESDTINVLGHVGRNSLWERLPYKFIKL